jgi:hypothetical protein
LRRELNANVPLGALDLNDVAALDFGNGLGIEALHRRRRRRVTALADDEPQHDGKGGRKEAEA